MNSDGRVQTCCPDAPHDPAAKCLPPYVTCEHGRHRVCIKCDQQGWPTSVEQALEVLREAGWTVQQDAGYGVLTAGLLASAYMGQGSRHVARWAREPWHPEDAS